MKNPPSKYILVVEDDQAVNEVLTEFISLLFPEFHVESAESGREGMEIVRKSHRVLALVVTDFNLGNEFAGTFLGEMDRMGLEMQAVPRVVISGMTDEEYHKGVRKGEKYGRYDVWLVKPADSEQLRSTLGMFLRRAKCS